MSTIINRQAANQQTSDPPRFLGTGYRRRPILAVASVVLMTSCVAVFTSVYLHAGKKVAVLALARDVPEGQPITRNDLSVVGVAFSRGLTPILAQDASRVVGQTAAVSLVRGTLVTQAELADRGEPSNGSTIVGVATKVGQLPAGGVADGDTVDVVLTGSLSTLTDGSPDGGSSDASSPAGAVEIGGILAQGATVTDVAQPTSSDPDTVVVSVSIRSSLAPLVASASAAGQAALVLVAPNA